MEFLNQYFSNGVGHIFGPLNGPRWHLYTADVDPRSELREQTVEIVMTQLDPKVLEPFHCVSVPSYSYSAPCSKSGEEATVRANFQSLFDSRSFVDSYLFAPNGYGCNGLLGEYYFAIHITPDFDRSYASFETNLPMKNSAYEELIHRVLALFRPGKCTVSLFVDEKSLVKNSHRALPEDFNGYV